MLFSVPAPERIYRVAPILVREATGRKMRPAFAKKKKVLLYRPSSEYLAKGLVGVNIKF